MIEFKADCGHTIRVEDKHAGRIVKCAYCGREVEAPSLRKGDTSLILHEVNLHELAKGEGGDATQPKMTIQGQQRGARSALADHGEGTSSAVRIALLIAYLAIGMVVLVVIIQVVVDMTRPEGPTVTAASPLSDRDVVTNEHNLHQQDAHTGNRRQPGSPPGRTADPAQIPRQVDARRTGRTGVSFSEHTAGVFVELFNRSARIYARSGDRDNDETLGVDESEFKGSGPQLLELEPGHYRIAVALEIDDSDLTYLPGYSRLRRSLEYDGNTQFASEFFVHDTSESTDFVDQAGMPKRIVRYYDIEVRPRSWSLITSLFVPGKTLDDLSKYIPNALLYRFDQQDIRKQLLDENVRSEEIPPVVDLLERLGQLVYELDDGTYRVFEINPQDGTLSIEDFEFEAPPAHTRQALDPIVQQKPRASGPWGPIGNRNEPRKADAQLPALTEAVEVFRDRLSRGQTIEAHEWRPYLVGGDGHTLWKSAEVTIRIAFAKLLSPDISRALLEPIGDTMLVEPELEVRLALLHALVRTQDRGALRFIDQRLRRLNELETQMDPDEADHERQELREAKRRLSKSPGGRNSPWG